MNKFIVTSVLLAPLACMNAYADREAAAEEAMRGALVELSAVAQQAMHKELVPLIGELHAALHPKTEGILHALTALTPEERMVLIANISQSPEMAELIQAVAPLDKSKAAATIEPLMQGKDAAALAAILTTTAKLQLIDIMADLSKIAVALGADQMAAAMMKAYNK